MEYKAVQVRVMPRPTNTQLPDERLWKNTFKETFRTQLVGKITSVSFANDPVRLLATASTRALMYDLQPGKLVKTFSRFNGVVLDGALRDDAKLMVAGCDTSEIRVFESASRVILRSFRGHTAAAHSVGFLSKESNQVFSCSDDRSVRTWDIKRGNGVSVLEGHEDRVRCARPLLKKQSILSGSYDGTVRLWDLRSGEETVRFDHGSPVQSVLCMPSASVVISAGENVVKVWDLMQNRLLTEFSNHLKQITSLSLHPDKTRLCTASLDGHVKIFNVLNYELTADLNFTKPIMSMTISGESDAPILAVGMIDGTLAVRKRLEKQGNSATGLGKKRMRTGSHKWFERGVTLPAGSDDLVVKHEKKRKLTKYDKLLKKFRHREALEAALQTNSAVIFTSVVKEVIQRSRLRGALSTCDDATIKRMIAFIRKHIVNPMHTDILVNVAQILMELFSQNDDNDIELAFGSLRDAIKNEVRLQRNLGNLLGPLEMIITSSS